MSLKDEPNKEAPWVEALADELHHFAAFNRCEQVEVGKLRDKAVRNLLTSVLGEQH